MNAPHDKLSGYVAYNPENKEIIVAFRGTVDPNWSMSGAFKNAMTDLDEEMIPFFKHAEILAHEGVLKGESLPRCPYIWSDANIIRYTTPQVISRYSRSSMPPSRR